MAASRRAAHGCDEHALWGHAAAVRSVAPDDDRRPAISRRAAIFASPQTSVPRAVGTGGGAHHLVRMCGRYASFLPAEFIARWFAAVNPLPNLAPTWNMAPTMDAPVVRLIDGNRHLDALK